MPQNYQTEQQLTQRVMEKVNLSKDKINLEEHVVNLSKSIVDLRKKSLVDLGEVKAKVVVILDYSGSMDTMYREGTVQRTLNRLVPLGLTFDDNSSIDLYLFQNNYKRFADLTLANYEEYVDRVILRSSYLMGGTCYAPVLKAVLGLEYLEPQKKSLWPFRSKAKRCDTIVDSEEPTFILFITDGANTDRYETDKAILAASEMNVLIQFIGLGHCTFDYLEKLDNLKGRTRDNTGFTRMQDLDKADDQTLYTKVLEQFANWLKGLQ